MSNFLGREESIGFGLQSSTSAVAPQIWTRHLKNGLRPVVNKKKNQSAMGRPEQTNGSVVMNRSGAGSVEMKLQDITIGYLLTSFFGGVTTEDNADESGDVKDHAFAVVPGTDKYLTVGEKSPVNDRRWPTALISSIEITSEASEEGDWVMVAADFVTGERVTATNTVAYQAENEFTQAHVKAKLATALAGLGAATVLETKSLKLTLTRTRTPFIPHGHKSPVAQDTGPLTVTGEATLRYKDNTLENVWYEGDTRAMLLSIINDDVTIGDAAHPGLTFTMPQIALDTHDRTDDLDSYVEQTVAWEAELSEEEGYMLATVLTNTQTAYTAA